MPRREAARHAPNAAAIAPFLRFASFSVEVTSMAAHAAFFSNMAQHGSAHRESRQQAILAQ